MNAATSPQLTLGMMTREAARLLHQFLPERVFMEYNPGNLIWPWEQIDVRFEIENPLVLTWSLENFSKEVLVSRVFALAVRMMKRNAVCVFDLPIPKGHEGYRCRFNNISVRGLKEYIIRTDTEWLRWDVLFLPKQ